MKHVKREERPSDDTYDAEGHNAAAPAASSSSATSHAAVSTTTTAAAATTSSSSSSSGHFAQQHSEPPPTHGGVWYLNDALELAPEVASGAVDRDFINVLQSQAIQRLSARDPLLRHVLDVKVVCNQRRTFINFTIKKEYMGMCHCDVIDNLRFCYFISDKLEPYVILTVVDPQVGRLHRLTKAQVGHLAQSLEKFRVRFGISNETYHYTPLRERQETDTFVRTGDKRGIPPPGTKAHSSHFHLKIRVATKMLEARMPIYSLLNIGALREAVEPVKYSFSRVSLDWEATLPLLMTDAE
ncbi:hypothetical protein Pelo_12833 [Pelomyxa schiedti]|nr:hypothetical protein Pelo_12833 [Pelomyxa schiedti]